MSLEQMLRELAEGSIEKYSSKGEAEKALRSFLKLPTIPADVKVGDLVERNELGRKRYRHPQEMAVAVCVEKFEKPVYDDNNNELLTMRIAVAFAKDMFRYYDVNGKYYRKSGTNTTNIFSFKRKK